MPAAAADITKSISINSNTTSNTRIQDTPGDTPGRATPGRKSLPTRYPVRWIYLNSVTQPVLTVPRQAEPEVGNCVTRRVHVRVSLMRLFLLRGSSVGKRHTVRLLSAFQYHTEYGFDLYDDYLPGTYSG
eukprot:2689435-Rhodomonas_salina.3